MKEVIEAKRLSPEFINLFHPVFNDKIIDVCLDNEGWIAGGFARKIAHMYFGVCKKPSEHVLPYRNLLEYFRYGGDIDIFTTSRKNLDHIESIVLDVTNKSEVKKSFKKSYYESPFALNFLPTQEFSLRLKEKLFHSVQIVNKFFFKNVKECFDSFDISNCKYAIRKQNNVYTLYYSNLALEDDTKGLLNICHTDSPFLGNRIYKYCYRHNLKVADNQNNKEMLREFCLKLLTKSWDEKFEFYSEDSFLEYTAKNLRRAESMPIENLSLFIGKINHDLNVMIPQGYGYYIANEIVDWASHEIQNMNQSNTCKKF